MDKTSMLKIGITDYEEQICKRLTALFLFLRKIKKNRHLRYDFSEVKNLNSKSPQIFSFLC